MRTYALSYFLSLVAFTKFYLFPILPNQYSEKSFAQDRYLRLFVAILYAYSLQYVP